MVNKANLRDLIAATGLVIFLKLWFKSLIFQPIFHWNLMDDLEKKGTSSVLRQVLCIILKPLVNSNWSYIPETLNSGQNRRFFCPVWPRNFDEWHWKTIGHLFYTTLSFVHYFKAIGEFSYSPETLNSGENRRFFCPVWSWNLMDDIEKQHGTSSMLLQALCIISKPSVNSNWSYSPETPNLCQNWWFFLVAWPWNLTDDLEKQ